MLPLDVSSFDCHPRWMIEVRPIDVIGYLLSGSTEVMHLLTVSSTQPPLVYLWKHVLFLHCVEKLFYCFDGYVKSVRDNISPYNYPFQKCKIQITTTKQLHFNHNVVWGYCESKDTHRLGTYKQLQLIFSYILCCHVKYHQKCRPKLEMSLKL